MKVNNSTNINKTNNYPSSQMTENKKPRLYVGNPDPVFDSFWTSLFGVVVITSSFFPFGIGIIVVVIVLYNFLRSVHHH
jgi:hypothetical protein